MDQEKLKNKVVNLVKDKKKPIKNTIVQEFNKGSVRNQKCPECGKKLKKCGCFVENKEESIYDDLV
jgi:hypothetical protein